MQVKKEPEAEPAAMVKPEAEEEVDMQQGQPQDKSEEAASAAVPEDVSLNTPISNPQVEDLESAASALTNEEGLEEADHQQPQELLHEQPLQSDLAKPEADPSAEAGAALEEGGGDLEGSVTEEAPPPDFDSDNEVVDDEPVIGADQSSATPPPPSDETIQPEPMEATEDASSSAVAFSDVSSRTEAVQENGQHALHEQEQQQQQQPLMAPPKETSAEEDLLTSTEATNMEEGDEQYKNIIAESQMDNIFN